MVYALDRLVEINSALMHSTASVVSALVSSILSPEKFKDDDPLFWAETNDLSEFPWITFIYQIIRYIFVR